MVTISFIQARQLIDAIDRRKPRTRLPVDLGLTAVNVDINYKFREARFSGVKIAFADIESIALDQTHCYHLEKSQSPQKLKLLSADTNNLYKLVPSSDAPTIEISGVPMHCLDGRTPWQDALDKISTIKPIRGRVLDTCCCLGYTAITAAKEEGASQVFTFERDSNVLELADYNPWSKELYLNRKIRLTIGDVFRGIEMFSMNHFNAIVHDPPRFELAEELYSLEFYKKLYRVLNKGGRLYHHTGEKSAQAMKLLKEAGFTHIKNRPDVKGVTAQNKN